MKLKYLGTAAAEGIPGVFCNCMRKILYLISSLDIGRKMCYSKQYEFLLKIFVGVNSDGDYQRRQ